MPHAIQWSETADARLLALRAQGMAWTDVAADLHVCRNAAIERGRRLGLAPRTRLQPMPRPTPDRVDRPALPPGHPISWRTINAGTSLFDEPYPYPVFP